MGKVGKGIGLASIWLLTACSDGGGNRQADANPTDEPPAWQFEQEFANQTEQTLTDVWVSANGDVYIVGFAGVILHRTEDPETTEPLWTQMESGTEENLTAILGVNNGAQFGLDAARGELFAVGWNGTLLHFHPNPDADPTTDDGQWQTISEPNGPAFVGLQKVDPFCPDFDGDGFPDDGDGDGYSGNALCSGGVVSGCDDNCRTAPNGDQRPIGDLNNDGCLGPGDGPSATDVQTDVDADGRGLACDPDDFSAEASSVFRPTFFDVWADANGDQLTVVAVGEDGAIVTYQGNTAAVAPTAPVLPVTDANAWVAQTGLPYRFDTDCDGATTPAGTVCAGSGRLPPSCPAQCAPARTDCNCPSGQGQCCDPSASTGAACVAPLTCGAAANACDPGTGICSSLCPGCFRRLDRTLRSVFSVGSNLVAVGARGTLVVGDPAMPNDVWSFPTCVVPPAPLDDEPVFTGISGSNGRFHMVGQAGATFRFSPNAGNCPYEPRTGAPQAFLSGVAAVGGNQAYAVGDRGIVLLVQGNQNPQVTDLDSGFEENFQGIVVDNQRSPERLWIVGANGSIVRAEFR